MITIMTMMMLTMNDDILVTAATLLHFIDPLHYK